MDFGVAVAAGVYLGPGVAGPDVEVVGVGVNPEVARTEVLDVGVWSVLLVVGTAHFGGLVNPLLFGGVVDVDDSGDGVGCFGAVGGDAWWGEGDVDCVVNSRTVGGEGSNPSHRSKGVFACDV